MGIVGLCVTAALLALLLVREVGRNRRAARNLRAARERARDARRDAAGARIALAHVARDRDQLAADLDVLVAGAIARHPSSRAESARLVLIPGGAA